MKSIASQRKRQEARSRRPVYGGVLIGGASTRMGQSKSLLRYAGTSFTSRVINAVRARTERVEPLLAIYEPESLALIEKLPARDLRSPHRLGDEPTVYTPTPPVSLCECWTNVNTPEEFHRLPRDSARAREEGGRLD